MPRASLASFFLGGSNRLASVVADAEETINLCLEEVAPGHSKTSGYFRSMPCVRPFLQVGTSGWVRGQITINGRTFAVVGELFGEVSFDGATASFTPYGVVDDDDALVSMSTNGREGHQIQICSGGTGYVFDLNTTTFATNQSLDPDFPDDVILTWFLKGWTFVLVENSAQFYISALFDCTSWDPLDTAIISDFPGNIRAALVVRDTVRFLGDAQGESWYANGDPLFAFAPIPGSMVNVGTTSAFAACTLENTCAYLAKDQFGNGIVRIDDGVQTNRVSTAAVEHDLRESTRLEDARLFVTQDQGHIFLWVWITDLEWTWIYDLMTQRWFKRALWNSTSCEFEPFVAANQTFAFEGHQLVGSRLNDVIYDMSFRFLSDELVP